MQELEDVKMALRVVQKQNSEAQAELLTLSNRLTDHILFNETLQRRNGLLKRSLVRNFCQMIAHNTMAHH
jgi:hypothetical protein